MKPRAWTKGDVCRIERTMPHPTSTVCIVADVDARDNRAYLVSVYPSGWEGWRPASDLKTVYANTLRRAIAAIEREQAELANRRRLVKLELDLRKKR